LNLKFGILLVNLTKRDRKWFQEFRDNEVRKKWKKYENVTEEMRKERDIIVSRKINYDRWRH